jgi:CheY-like chemotaxis protein
MLKRTLGAHVEVEARLMPDLWLCSVDTTQIQDAILNLAINARDAMPRGGTLTIETQNASLDEYYAAQESEVVVGDYVLLAVSDTGSGMTKEVLARAFEPFFTTKGQERGTGLGLSMVYGFTKQSKGHAKIYSEVGHGTIVKIYLPRSLMERSRTAERPASAAPPHGTETILVVEDNEGIREVALDQLDRLGYRTFDAKNPREALALLDEHPEIAVLFTDVVMPGGMSGYDLVKEARKKRPDLKVLMTSGYTAPALANGVRELEGLEIINKPFRKADLAIKLRSVLDKE